MNAERKILIVEHETRTDEMVTSEMMDAAMKNAVEWGILPRKAATEDLTINREIMFEIIDAALSVNAEDEFGTAHRLD